MSKERELLERWVSQFGNLRHDFNLLTATKELLAEQDSMAVMPNGTRVANVYDAYEEGRRAALSEVVDSQPEQEPVEDRIARWHKLGYEQGKKASKREPLSDETIAKLWGESYSGTTQMVRNFARAIEKAHGITGGEE